MAELREFEIALLETLDEIVGFAVRDISRMCRHPYCIGHNRARSGAIRSDLLELEKKGLVRRLDDANPIYWVRTDDGTASLKEPTDA